MPNTLLPIQYTPMAAGMMKQNHRLMSGIIRFMLFIWACCCVSTPVWGLAMLATFMLSHERPAETSGISARPIVAKLTIAVPAKISFMVSQGTVPRFSPRKLKSRSTSLSSSARLSAESAPRRYSTVSLQCSCMTLASLISI